MAFHDFLVPAGRCLALMIRQRVDTSDLRMFWFGPGSIPTENAASTVALAMCLMVSGHFSAQNYLK